jgi:hypothetical protein
VPAHHHSRIGADMTTRLKKLQNCKSKPDFARLLGIKPVFLTRVVYIRNTEKLYTDFSINKKNGDKRIISSPDPELKEIQSRLSDLLQDCLADIRTSHKVNNTLSHGFERERSIITNAEKHKSKKWVLNLDLSNFFDEFNFGRVRGYFIKNSNFKLNEKVSNIISKIACYENRLPQGSPCSPVITNLILQSLDQRLNLICKNAGCTYTRYADDITISTNKSEFPKKIIASRDNNTVNLNERFLKEITSSGFSLNFDKVRLLDKNCRQEVTGLTVNKTVNVSDTYARSVRAMAHSLFKNGDFYLIDKQTNQKRLGAINELTGMLGFIDSLDKHNNKISHKNHGTLNKRERLYSDFLYYKSFCANEKPMILTEGKTDITYLRVALDSLAKNYPTLVGNKKGRVSYVRDYKISFFKNSIKSKYFLKLDGGSSHLKDFLVNYNKKSAEYSKSQYEKPVIMILDNDSGSNGGGGIFQCLLGKSFPNITITSKDTLRKEKWIWVTKNLYIIFTPLNGEQESSMEDLFDESVLKRTLSKKTFNRTNNKCKDNEYGKEAFAKGIVLKRRKKINFTKFSIIFDSITEIINHHESMK